MPDLPRLFIDTMLLILFLGLLVLPVTSIGFTGFQTDLRGYEAEVLGEKDKNVEYYTITDNLNENLYFVPETTESTFSL